MRQRAGKGSRQRSTCSITHQPGACVAIAQPRHAQCIAWQGDRVLVQCSVRSWSSWQSCHHSHAASQRHCCAQAVSVSVTDTSASTSQPQQPQQPHADLDSATKDWELEMEELLKLVALLPPSVRSHVEEHPRLPELVEVVMDLGRPPLARFPDGDVRLGDGVVTTEDLEVAVQQVGEFGGDNRAGIDRTLHRISCIRNRSGRIIGLTCRVGRAIRGSAKLVSDLVTSGASILFLGRPGVGKTTVIREVSRALADELQKRVVIVDTSNEIGGDGDIPHEGIGRARRIQVPHPDQQHRVMIEAVENHMPQVVVIDEIGTGEECAAARTIAQRGVQLVATAHGNELENVVKNPSLADLVGGIQSVTLGDEEARKRGVQKSILERAGPPTFDVAVEMLDRTRWRVHLDTAQAVDLLLAGGSPGGQVRERASDGTIMRYTHDPAVSSAVARQPKDFSSSNGNNAAMTAKAAKAAAMAALAAQEASAAAALASSGLPNKLSSRGSNGAVSSSGSISSSGVPSSTSSGMSAGSSSGSSVAASSSASSAASRSLSSLDGGSMADLADEEAAMLAEGVGGARASGFTKRSVLGSIEAQADAEEAAQFEDDGVPTQQGARRLASRQTLMGVQPSTVVLRLFPYELDADKLWEVMSAMDLTHKVLIVRRVAQADAVLGLRARVKTDAALRTAAKAARVPIYAIKATGTSNLVRALRTLLGIDPSAGGVFVRGSKADTEGSSDEEGAEQQQPAVDDDVQLQDGAGQPAVTGSLRAEIDIASIRQGRQQHQGEGSSQSAGQGQASSNGSIGNAGSTRMLREAIEEVRAACVNLVAPLGQPVELMPRPLHIIQAQQQVVDEYGLGWQVLGSAADSRLRVEPLRQ